MDSILTSIKKLLGIQEDYTHFDTDIIIHVNSALMILNQLGVGPLGGFSIVDSSTTWDEFIPEDDKNFEAAKTYVYMKVKLIFDPPSSSAVIESMNRIISEIEWRLTVQHDAAQST